MVSIPKYKNADEIKRQLESTTEMIEQFEDEVVSADPRYPNFDNHIKSLRNSITQAEDALVSMERLNVTDEVKIDRIVEITEHAISTIQRKGNQEQGGVLVAALIVLHELQDMLQDIDLDQNSGFRHRKVDPTETDTGTGGSR